MRQCVVQLLLLTFVAWGAGCSPTPGVGQPPARSVVKLSIKGVERSYILRIPPAYDCVKKVPLVILLHGATDSAAYAEEAYHFAEKADAAGFVLALPDALGENHAWHGFMLDTGENPNNDLAFLNALLATLPKAYAIDSDRIFLCGHSSGAMMAYRMAAERPDAIAATGIVAGTVGSNGYDPPVIIPTPRGPMPLIVFHGKKDTIVPYEGDPSGPFSVSASIHFWAALNRCTDAPTATDRPVANVQRDTFAPRPGGAEIVLYTLADGNHMWPGGKAMAGKTMVPVEDIAATDLMWDFFCKHSHQRPPAMPELSR